jgi:hypothetical protein
MSAERQMREVHQAWTMTRGNGQVPARMVTRAQIMHYREMNADAAAYAAAGVDRETAPRPVPELDTHTAAGGRLSLSAFRPVRITEPAPFDDVWGDAR